MIGRRILKRLSVVLDAGYGEKVLFAAVDEEAADENDTSKIEDEVNKNCLFEKKETNLNEFFL